MCVGVLPVYPVPLESPTSGGKGWVSRLVSGSEDRDQSVSWVSSFFLSLPFFPRSPSCFPTVVFFSFASKVFGSLGST